MVSCRPCLSGLYVDIKTSLTLIGGFSCAWEATGAKAKIAPAKGIALVFVSESKDVTFKNAVMAPARRAVLVQTAHRPMQEESPLPSRESLGLMAGTPRQQRRAHPTAIRAKAAEEAALGSI